jgi:hypothetical protein
MLAVSLPARLKMLLTHSAGGTTLVLRVLHFVQCLKAMTVVTGCSDMQLAWDIRRSVFSPCDMRTGLRQIKGMKTCAYLDVKV